MTRGQLFVRLPVPVRVPELSDAMRLALQWLEVLGGRPLSEHPNFRREDEAERRSIRPVVLKKLIRLGLIEVMGLSPARYRVTKLGKVARSLGGANSG